MRKNREKVSKIEDLTRSLKVCQAMTARVITVSPRATINRLRTVLRDAGISGVPVLSAGRLVGIISLEDLIKCLINREMNALVATKMTRQITVVHPDESLVHAVRILEQTGLGRLPVVDRESGKLEGILTKRDVILCLMKKLDELYLHEEQLHCETAHLFEDIIGGDVRLTFSFPIKGGDFKNAGKASSRLRENLVRLGLPPDTVRRLAITSYEAEMNMVIYSHGGSLEGCIEKHRVQVKAWDRGPGIEDIEKALTPGFTTAPDWVRELGFGAGMGLPNIQRYSDKMSIKSEVGKYTRLTFEVQVS